MRAALGAAVAVLCLCGPRAAHAEQLTIALSTPEVKIDSSFTGIAVTVFGVIGRDAAAVARGAGYKIVALVEGPSETVVARRKDRFLAIWANRASKVLAAPAFYAVSSTGPLEAAAGPAQRRQLQLGLDAIDMADWGRAGDPASIQFRDAFLRLKREANLYSADERVEFIGDSIFRTTAWIPANVPVGSYTVTVFLFADQDLLAKASESFLVSKIGVERLIVAFSRNQSLAYGLATVALALFSGWLAGVVFRRD